MYGAPVPRGTPQGNPLAARMASSFAGSWGNLCVETINNVVLINTCGICDYCCLYKVP